MAHELSTADKLSSKMTMGSIAKQKIIAEETCTMILSETLTDICLSLPSLLIATDTREVMQVDERNSRYEAVVKSHANVDGFSSRPTQTKNFPQKNQNEMAAPSAVKEAGTQATAYEIVDTIAKTVSVSADFEQHTIAVGTDSTSTGTDDSAGVTPSVRKFITDTVGMSLVTPGCLLDTSNVVKPPGFGEKGSKSEKRSKPSGGRNTSALSMGGGGSNLGNVGGAYGSTMDVEAITTGHSQQDVSGHTHHRRNSKDGLNPMASTASSGNNSNTGGAHNRDTTGKGAGSRTNIANEDSNASEGGGAAAASGPSFTEEDSLQIIRETEINKILTSAMLLKRLQMVERAIQQNKNHRSQLDYRDLPDISPIILVSPDRVKVVDTSDQLFRGLGGPEATKNAYQMKKPLHDNKSRTTSFSHTSTSVNSEMNSPVKDEHKITLESAMADSSNGPKVKRLFCYSNDELVQGRAVTCMVWNSVSTDLLAVGYGKIDTVIDSHKLGEILDEEKQGGLVLFWSLRNPDYPEKILRTKFPVTALAFSKLSPMILAVGLFNGDVCIYDVKRESNWGVPVESSSGMTNSHSDPVW